MVRSLKRSARAGRTGVAARIDPAARRVFERYPPPLRRRLLALRELILKTAARTPGVGALEETLKWHEPAYLTAQPKTGSTIRINAKPDGARYAIYFNCNTGLVGTFRTLFPKLTYEGNRAIVFDVDAAVPRKELRLCIGMALTYHRDRPNQRYTRT
jgi:hypothetical protein